jgi:hypothetical protein
MPADLVPEAAIPELAAKIDSPAVLKVLALLQQRDFILNDSQVDEDTAAALSRLAELGLADPGYAEPANGEPFIWVSNSNGKRALKYLESNRRHQVRMHPRVRTALGSLTNADQGAVKAVAEALLLGDPGSWPGDQARPLSPDGSAYLLRASPDLWVYVTVLPSGDFEVSDVVRQDTLRVFLERLAATGKAG